MTQYIREVMTTDPVVAEANDTVYDAACRMRDEDIGDVLVVERDELIGLVTDRDIVVRCVAAGLDPMTAPLMEILSHSLVALQPDDSVEEAIKLMSSLAIRRIPVVEDGKPVGVVSIGDLAMARDPNSVLAGISAAPPNN